MHTNRGTNVPRTSLPCPPRYGNSTRRRFAKSTRCEPPPGVLPQWRWKHRPAASATTTFIPYYLDKRDWHEDTSVFSLHGDLMEWYSLLVDFSPTFYCLPKPLLLYGSMVLLSALISTILLQCTTLQWLYWVMIGGCAWLLIGELFVLV